MLVFRFVMLMKEEKMFKIRRNKIVNVNKIIIKDYKSVFGR